MKSKNIYQMIKAMAETQCTFTERGCHRKSASMRVEWRTVKRQRGLVACQSEAFNIMKQEFIYHNLANT